jgi:hypothetical protein
MPYRAATGLRVMVRRARTGFIFGRAAFDDLAVRPKMNVGVTEHRRKRAASDRQPNKKRFTSNVQQRCRSVFVKL